MEQKAAENKVAAQIENTNSIETPDTKEDRGSTSLPSPPVSLVAAESDSGRRKNESHLGELAGGEPPHGESSAYTETEADTCMKGSTILFSMKADCQNSRCLERGASPQPNVP